MQDWYFGDIGDFAKFGLLRGIVAHDPTVRRGVLWYLVPDESHTKDGRRIAYLEPSPKNRKSFRPCDLVLYDKPGKLVREGRRAVSSSSSLLRAAPLLGALPASPPRKRLMWNEKAWAEIKSLG